MHRRNKYHIGLKSTGKLLSFKTICRCHVLQKCGFVDTEFLNMLQQTQNKCYLVLIAFYRVPTSPQKLNTIWLITNRRRLCKSSGTLLHIQHVHSSIHHPNSFSSAYPSCHWGRCGVHFGHTVSHIETDKLYSILYRKVYKITVFTLYKDIHDPCGVCFQNTIFPNHTSPWPPPP